jgi:hypothetical protein
MKITKCTGEGQGSCKRCSDKGKWNRTWMCFLYKIEGYEGCYCSGCVKELQDHPTEMMAYIDKDLLLKDIDESVVFSVRKANPSLEIRGARKIVDRIKTAPEVDVEEVVHCIDCVYWDGNGYSGRCEAPSNGLVRDYTNYDDFCSYGERSDT